MMAPPAFMSNSKHPIFAIADQAGGVENILHELGKKQLTVLYIESQELDKNNKYKTFIGLYEFLPTSPLMTYIAHEVCDEDHPLASQVKPEVCFVDKYFKCMSTLDLQ